MDPVILESRRKREKRQMVLALAVGLFLSSAPPVFSQTPHSEASPQKKAAETPAAKAGAGTGAATPDPSDKIAALRLWRDVTDSHSVKARLQSVGKDIVTLKKQDGSVVEVPRAKLYRDDQELVRRFVMANSEKVLIKAVAKFFKADFGATTVRIAENEKIEFNKLAAKVGGQTIQLSFAIGNVSKYQHSTSPVEAMFDFFLERGGLKNPKANASPPAIYQLDFSGTDLPGEYRYLSSTLARLSKSQALKLGPSSAVVVEGRIKLAFYHGEKRPQGLVFWEADGRGIALSLDHAKTKIQEAAKGDKPK